MEYYPLFLDLHGLHCCIVGAGAVGRRKLVTLLEHGAGSVLLLDLCPPDTELAALLHDPRIHFAQRTFREDDLEGCALVFAATGNREANAAITAACARRQVLCNCADAPHEGRFLVPAIARQGRITAALSTGGASPALARVLRQELEGWLESWAALACLLERLRPLVLTLPAAAFAPSPEKTIAFRSRTAHNTDLFRALVHCTELRAALNARDRQRCEGLLLDLLPAALHPHLPELLHDLA